MERSYPYSERDTQTGRERPRQDSEERVWERNKEKKRGGGERKRRKACKTNQSKYKDEKEHSHQQSSRLTRRKQITLRGAGRSYCMGCHSDEVLQEV